MERQVTAKGVALRNLQRERQERGTDFQDEIRRSWRLVPNCWRTRITDGEGGTRPADELILLQDWNVIAEHKRTMGRSFDLSFLRKNQLMGLGDFDTVIERNRGLVFVSFLDEKHNLDETYVFRLITALKHMKKHKRLHIHLEELRHRNLPCVNLFLVDAQERTYDLNRLVKNLSLL